MRKARIPRPVVNRDLVVSTKITRPLGNRNEEAFLAGVLSPFKYSNLRYPSSFSSGTCVIESVEDVNPINVVIGAGPTNISATIIHPTASYGCHYMNTIGTCTGASNVELGVYNSYNLEATTFLSDNAARVRVVSQSVMVEPTVAAENANGMIYLGLTPICDGVIPNTSYELHGDILMDGGSTLQIPMTKFCASNGVEIVNYPIGFETTGVSSNSTGHDVGTRFMMSRPLYSANIFDNSVYVAVESSSVPNIKITVCTHYEYIPDYDDFVADPAVCIGDPNVVAKLAASLGLSASGVVTDFITAVNGVAGPRGDSTFEALLNAHHMVERMSGFRSKLSAGSQSLGKGRAPSLKLYSDEGQKIFLCKKLGLDPTQFAGFGELKEQLLENMSRSSTNEEKTFEMLPAEGSFRKSGRIVKH